MKIMKPQCRSTLLTLGGFFIAAFITLFADTAQADVGYALVKKVQGTVKYTSAIGQGPLKVGQVLTAGARITTDAGSYVDLNLGVNGDALRVEESSTVTLTELTFRKTRMGDVVKTEMNVTKGHVVANVVRKLSRNSRYNIRTPNGVAGIRGTCIQAGVTGVLAVIGQVQFTPVNGQVQLVVGGFVMAVGQNQPIRAAVVRIKVLRLRLPPAQPMPGRQQWFRRLSSNLRRRWQLKRLLVVLRQILSRPRLLPLRLPPPWLTPWLQRCNKQQPLRLPKSGLPLNRLQPLFNRRRRR